MKITFKFNVVDAEKLVQTKIFNKNNDIVGEIVSVDKNINTVDAVIYDEYIEEVLDGYSISIGKQEKISLNK